MTVLRDALFIAAKDARYTLREKETLFWIVLMPVVFFYFIGTVTSGFGGGGGGGGKDRLALNVAADPGFLADEIALRLAENDYDVQRTQQGAAGAAGAADGAGGTPGDAGDSGSPGSTGGQSNSGQPNGERRLALPERFTARVLAGEQVQVQLARDESGIALDYDTVRVGRAVYTVLADLVACSEAGEEPTAAAFARLRALPRTLSIQVESAGQRQRIPTGYEQTIPGTMVMFTLLVLLTSGAVLLVIERRQGLLRRLAATPIARGDLVLGKWGGKMALAVVQLAIAMIIGTALFDMDWGSDLPMIALLLLAWAGFCASLGLVLGCIARSEGQAIGLGVLAANVLAALGGCWWPIEITPAWMQSLQKCLPTGWAMDALHQLISFGSGSSAALPHLAALVVGALGVGWVAVRQFRFA